MHVSFKGLAGRHMDSMIHEFFSLPDINIYEVVANSQALLTFV